jgi:dTMP kinase
MSDAERTTSSKKTPNGMPFIVIDGTDGSGKGTQTKLLVERLQREGHNVEQLSFPRYSQQSAYFVEQYLNGQYGTGMDVGPHKSSLFYALDRFDASAGIRAALAAGTVVISDRYVSANKGHQMGKITDQTERKAFLDWINDLEYRILGIPKPDLTILLHMPSEIAYELIAKKDERGYLNGKKRDIHEADPGHLKAAEQAYLDIPSMDTVENWEVVSCMENGALMSIDAIHERLWQRVHQLLG